jgi:hypothetical protein
MPGSDRVVRAAHHRHPGPVRRAGAQRAQRVVDHHHRTRQPEPSAQLALEHLEVLRPVGARQAEHRGIDRSGTLRGADRVRDRPQRGVRGLGAVDVAAARATGPDDPPVGVGDGGERLSVAAVHGEHTRAHSFTDPANIPRMKLRCRKT